MYRLLPVILIAFFPARQTTGEEQYGAERTVIQIGKHKGFILQPGKPARERHWVWYAPTIGSHPNKGNEWVLRKLLDSGFHVCGIDVGESYGSPAGRTVFSDFHQHVVRKFKLESRASLLAQSRGGLMLYNWAAENPDKVRCIAGIYPVCDLRSYPGLAKAAGAYEMTPAELQNQLSQHNPIDRLEPLAKAGVPILHIHGDSDKVVPLDTNSQIIKERYTALGGKMKLIVVRGKGHAEIPEFFQEPRLVQFLKDGQYAESSDSVGLQPAPPPAENWPRFRGANGTGVTDLPLPTKWDAKTNIVWQAEVPGLGWSSPIIWGDRVFVTAVLNDKTPMPRRGLYIQDLLGKVPPGEHVWKLYCFDFATGKLRWQRNAHQGTPGGPIHLKNTYASETPVTDGQHVYVYFGNLGVYCFDMDGNAKWSRSIAPRKTRMGWGTGSSPVLHGDRLYLVNDNEEDSYLLALDKHTGDEIWKSPRDEKSTWGTPFIWQNKVRTEIVTAGTKRVRSYDLGGKLLWELGGMSSISIPSPFAHDDLLYVASGYVLDPSRPLYAIKAGAMGDISLKAKESANDSVSWHQPLAGPYHPTPLVFRDQVYVLLDRGFLASYDSRSGKQIYGKQRIDPTSDKFTASPWAADGKIYCLSEDGDTYVIRAGPKFEVLSKNALDEMCLATPALSRGSIVLRTMSKLYRIGPAK